jgi:photosystem II stability/assembly factor-like uncharacterized protein
MKIFYRFSIILTLLLCGNINAQGWIQCGAQSQLPSFYAISAVNDTVCWFTGDLSLTVLAQLHSSGNSYSWSPNNLVDPATSCYTIYGRSSTVAYTGSSNGKIFKTTNGGTSWTKQFTQSGGAFIDGIYFWTDNLGIAFGDPVAYPNTGPFTVLRTTDGGTNWIDISTSLSSVTAQSGYNQAFDVVGTHFWFPSHPSNSDTTEPRYLFHSRDYGLTWEQLNIPLNFGDFWVAFSDTANGLITDWQGKTARTTDGGKTWSVKYNGVGCEPLAIQKGTGNVWVGGYYANQINYYAPIYFSSDFGSTWSKQAKLSPVPIDAMAVASQNVVWACGYDYLMLRNSNATSVTSVKSEQVNSSVPSSFELSQNYPNPFNPTTTIKYHVEKPGNTKLVVYNLLGRDIRTLVNDNQSAGWHLVVWDGTNDSRQPVSTGPYFYRIESNGQSMTKKMILLK